jgi:DNA-binding NtrC family response regulator
MTTAKRILIVDDDRETCRLIAELVGAPDRTIAEAVSAREALDQIRHQPFDLVISDINLNDAASGLDILKEMKARHPAGQVVLISAFGTLETAVAAVRSGAFDYISKPFNVAEVKTTVERALSKGAEPPLPLQSGDDVPAGMVGRSAGMLAVYKQVAYAADSWAPVLVTGESGTGKELVARAIHRHSRRASRPFVAVNCGALAETLLESELFGHVRGSFSGAITDHKGVFEQAQGGTVFLDEIGDTTPALQVKLLRVLQERELRPVGATKPVAVDARVVAATNIDLERAVAEHRFRHDLYYRLSVVVISLPPLRERRGDIPLLIQQFLQASSARRGRKVAMAAGAIEALTRYDWPGNVRELENTIERLVVFSRGDIDVGDLPPAVTAARPLEERLFDGLPTLDELERRYLLHVLESVGSNRTRAAEALGVDRRTLYRMAERFGIDLTDDSPKS